VKNIIEKFFRGEDWRTLVNLKSSKQEPFVDKNIRRIESFKEGGEAIMISEEFLTKEEFSHKLENFPRSSNATTYGVFAELSNPFIMIKNSDGQWEVMLNFENPNMDVKLGENENYQSFEKISDIKK
jgi:hypothetical protein